MEQTPPPNPDTDFPGRIAAIRLGGAMLVVLFLVIILVWRDNGQRVAWETTALLTGVGDVHYYSIPQPPGDPPYPPAASFRGRVLYPVDYSRREFRDDDMLRVGADERSGLLLYEAPPRSHETLENKNHPGYFLKLAPNEYLKVTTYLENPPQTSPSAQRNAPHPSNAKSAPCDAPRRCSPDPGQTSPSPKTCRHS